MAAQETEQNRYVQIQFQPDYEMFCEECVDKENLKNVSLPEVQSLNEIEAKTKRNINVSLSKPGFISVMLISVYPYYTVAELQHLVNNIEFDYVLVVQRWCQDVFVKLFSFLIYFTYVYCLVKCRFSTISKWT